MKCTPNKQENVIEQVKELLKERGSKALEEARKTILQEEVECKEVREALTYFMQEYWQDLARPTLLSIACEAVGGDPEVTTPIAVPMIIMSGAIDIHDDIIDQSEVKESRPTVLGKFGKDVALLVGDALLFEGVALLYETVQRKVSPRKARVVINVIKNMFKELGDAESLELSFRGRTDVTPEEYLHVVTKKAADVEAYTCISAVIGGGSRKEIDALSKYGRILGMIAILRDDLSDMLDFQEISNRIKKECLPLPLLFALQNLEVKSKIEALLQKEKLVRKDAKTIFEITRKSGGLERFLKVMKELRGKAFLYTRKLTTNQNFLNLLVESMIPPLR